MTTRYEVIQNEFERQVADREAAFHELSKLAWRSVTALQSYLGIEADDSIIKRPGKENVAKVALGRVVNGDFEPCYRHELDMQLGHIKYSVAIANSHEGSLNVLHMDVRLHIEPSGYVFKLLGTDDSVTIQRLESDGDFEPFCELIFERYRKYYTKRP